MLHTCFNDIFKFFPQDGICFLLWISEEVTEHFEFGIVEIMQTHGTESHTELTVWDGVLLERVKILEKLTYLQRIKASTKCELLKSSLCLGNFVLFILLCTTLLTQNKEQTCTVFDQLQFCYQQSKQNFRFYLTIEI